MASKYGKVDIVNRLLDRNAAMNTKNNEGKTIVDKPEIFALVAW